MISVRLLVTASVASASLIGSEQEISDAEGDFTGVLDGQDWASTFDSPHVKKSNEARFKAVRK